MGRITLGLLSVVLLALGLAGPAWAQSKVSVFPVLGSRLASPQTQITFRGVNPLLISGVTVSGSQSGSHAGVVVGDSDGDGGSFLPTAPFDPGETVTVRTPFELVGAPGGSYQFQVANPAGEIPINSPPLAARVSGDTLAFRSRADLAPAAVKMLKSPAEPPRQDIFVAPQFGPVQNGPMILDPRGRLIWFKPMPKNDVATDFRVQSYEGRPVLTWWQGYSAAGVGVGSDEIYDASYEPVATVQAGNGLSADLHEFELTPARTALITAYFPVYWDASSIHGSKNEIVLDSVVQLIDIPTGLVLFQWDSLDHIPLAQSYQPLPEEPHKTSRYPFDYFHVNSVQLDSDGNLIISARNTWAAYKLNVIDGSVMWTLGGKSSSFRMGPGTGFAFQHDVHVVGAGDRDVTLFDDGGGPPRVQPQSRVLELALDTRHMTASLTLAVQHSPSLVAAFEGNAQQLPGGYQFVGWGQQPYFSEFGPRGRLRLDARFVGGTSSYRAYRFVWAGQPTDPPAIAVVPTGPRTATVDASWNGATAVSAWRVLAGATTKRLHPVAKAPRSGFETAIRIRRAAWVRVQALGDGGGVLGSSVAVRPH